MSGIGICGVEKIGERYVVYGMGNFLSNQSMECCPAASQDGVIVLVEFAERVGQGFMMERLRYVPTFVNRRAFRVLPVAQAYARPGTREELRRSLLASWRRTTGTFTSLGAPVVPDVPLQAA